MSETPSVPPTVQFGTPVHNPAFPVIGGSSPYTQMDYEGMSIREYFAAHAPAEPQPWFVPSIPVDMKVGGPIYEALYMLERCIQWPWAWADLVLDARKRQAPIYDIYREARP